MKMISGRFSLIVLFSEDEHVFHYGETVPPNTCYTSFPPQAGGCSAHTIFITLFIKTEKSIIRSISSMISMQDNWGDFHPLEIALFPPDIDHSIELLEQLTGA